MCTCCRKGFLQVFKSIKSKDLQTCHDLSCYELNYISAKPEPHLTQIQWSTSASIQILVQFNTSMVSDGSRAAVAKDFIWKTDLMPHESCHALQKV